MRTTSGHLIYTEVKSMDKKIYQEPLTIDEQINNLSNIGLIISNREEVKNFLNDVSYFRFIKAFSIGLKQKNGGYNSGVTFDEIKELYLFNCNFRQSLFVQIEKIEINLRCRISNYFSCKYGNFGYEDSSNFNDSVYHTQFLADIDFEISRNEKAPFVKNFRNNYETGKLPLYALIELFSFGTLSKFYKNMKNEDKKEVAKLYGVGYTYLESWIEHIAFVRNICAHYGRLYNVNLAKTPSLYKQYSNIGINNKRIFATLLCIRYLLLNDKHWDEYVDLIGLFFEKYPNVKIDLMGFPPDWDKLLRHK